MQKYYKEKNALKQNISIKFMIYFYFFTTCFLNKLRKKL